MRVLPITTVNNKFYENNYANRTSYKNISNVYSANNCSNSLSSVSISFKSKLTSAPKSYKDILAIIKTEIQPFIEKDENLYQRAGAVVRKMKNEISVFKEALNVDFKPSEVEGAQKLRFPELEKNIKEYELFAYYRDFKPKDSVEWTESEAFEIYHSEQRYASKETNDFSRAMSDYFVVPDFLKEAYLEYKGLETNVKQAIQGLDTDSSPILTKKLGEYDEMIRNIDKNEDDTASILFDSLQKQLDNRNSNVDELWDSVSELLSVIEERQSKLKGREQSIAEAKNLTGNMFTETDHKLLQRIKQKRTDAVNEVKNHFSNTALKTELSDAQSQQLDDLINRQNQLLKELHERLKKDLDAYNAR